jgi:hypothetical protein
MSQILKGKKNDKGNERKKDGGSVAFHPVLFPALSSMHSEASV